MDLEQKSSIHTSDHEEVLKPKAMTDDDLRAFMNDQGVNRRNFNINDINGRFKRDTAGRIINRDQVLREMGFKDLDGKPVNEKGYLIDEFTGMIRSKYNYENLFYPIKDGPDKGEIPMPYRLEKYNFNPHEIIGNFEYTTPHKGSTKIPVI